MFMGLFYALFAAVSSISIGGIGLFSALAILANNLHR